MAQGRNHRLGHPFDIPARWLWIRWPVIIVSGGSTAVAIWGEEMLLIECAPLAFFPLLAGPLYLVNHLIFEATKLRWEDLSAKDSHHTTPKGHRS
mgnify:CR=1 FL=1